MHIRNMKEFIVYSAHDRSVTLKAGAMEKKIHGVKKKLRTQARIIGDRKWIWTRG